MKSLTSLQSAQLSSCRRLCLRYRPAAGVPTVAAGAQVLTTDNVAANRRCAASRPKNLPDIDATNAPVMGKDGTVYYGRGADVSTKIA